MGMVGFASKPVPEGELLTLVGENGEIVPFDDWTLRAPAQSRSIASDLLDRWANDARSADGQPLVAPQDDGSVALHGAMVAALSEQEASALGLPQAIRIQLEIESSGLFGRPGFRLETRWVRPGGLAARVIPVDGRLRFNGQEWRIAEPLWSTLAAVRSVNGAADDAAQQFAMSLLRETLGAAEGDVLHPDGFLKRLRISYAVGFSLDLKTEGGKFDFDPILFSRARSNAAQDGEIPDGVDDGLLPPSLQQKFVEKFRGSGRALNAYRLDDCTIVYLDPELKGALEIVRRAQGLDEESRRKFALSPRRYISEAMPDAASADEAVDALFIETQQYSERVNGIDIWRKPVLPWIKPKPNSWLPESFGLYIGDPPEGEQVDIELDQLDSAIESLEAVVAGEQESVEIAGKKVPATAQALDALRSLRDRLTQELPEKPEVDDASATPGPLFLTVSENFERLEYEESALGAAQAFSAPRFPGVVASSPKDHQRTGFDWLAEAWTNRLPGVLLADDMGLGKTYQLLAFLAWLRHDQGVREPLQRSVPRMVRYSPGDDREWEIFSGHLNNRAIEHLIIRDPYALAGRRNRLLTADFATHLARKVPSISRVTVIAWDAESARNDNYESTQRSADEMEREWNRRFMGRVPLLLELKSRGEDRRFHDRWVEAYLVEGDRLSWNLTSGVDGFMNSDSECTVSFWDQ